VTSRTLTRTDANQRALVPASAFAAAAVGQTTPHPPGEAGSQPAPKTRGACAAAARPAPQGAFASKVVSRWTASGTHTGSLNLLTGPVAPTGRPISFEEIRIDRHADGKIVESWFMPDRLTIWSQLGLLRSRGTAAQSADGE
jgi:SnoaL-like polyketide cyclase